MSGCVYKHTHIYIDILLLSPSIYVSMCVCLCVHVWAYLYNFMGKKITCQITFYFDGFLSKFTLLEHRLSKT